MRNSSLLRAAVATTVLIGVSAAVQAQSEPQKIAKTAKTKQQKPAVKSHKVWTEDDISSVRTPADAVIDAQDRQTASNAAAVQEASDKQPVGGPSKPPAKKAPLSQAKSAEDADAKIGWEKRDIQGQEEYIASLEERLASATPEERAHLQQIIGQHKQIIIDTRKEMQGLEEQKKEFQNQKKSPAPAPAAEPATSAEAQPPSQ